MNLRPQNTPPPFSNRDRFVIVVMAFLNILIGIDSGRMPYFTQLVWTLMYFFIAFNLFIFYFIPTRKWLLRSASVITAVGTLRGLSYLFYDQRIVPIGLNMQIVLLTWAFYRLRSGALEEGK